MLSGAGPNFAWGLTDKSSGGCVRAAAKRASST